MNCGQILSNLGKLYEKYLLSRKIIEYFSDPTPEANSRHVQWTRLQYDKATAHANYLSIGATPTMKAEFSPRAVEVWADLVPAILSAVEQPQLISHFAEQSCNLPEKYSALAGIGIAIIVLLAFLCVLLLVYIFVKHKRNKGTVFITAEQQRREPVETDADGNVKTLYGSRY